MKKLLSALLLAILFIFTSCSSEMPAPSPTPSAPEPSPTPLFEFDKTQKVNVIDCYGANGTDYIINFNLDREIRVLQLADIQLIDVENARPTRYDQLYNTYFQSGVLSHYERAWKYVDEAVLLGIPDLIVLTGDNVQGETDDDGSDWLELIEKLDSYNVPWLCVFGNHDNESAMGVTWQCLQLSASKNCVFKSGNVSGNSNYSVLIAKNGEPQYMFYMLDSNGATQYPNNYGEGILPTNVDISKIQQHLGVQQDQILWFYSSYLKASAKFGKIPSLMFFHIPPIQSNLEVDFNEGAYTVTDSAFGIYKEVIGGFDGSGLISFAKNTNCKGMFYGHQHNVAVSSVYEGIRMTHGLKTSTHCYHDSEMLGSTLILLKSQSDFQVKYLFSQLKYNL